MDNLESYDTKYLFLEISKTIKIACASCLK